MGKYVVAVSGGVDSVVLLHLLTYNLKPITYNLVIAHFDHGMRDTSPQDEAFVRELAGKYKIPYLTERKELGKGASEATARAARYDFLRRVLKDTKSKAILTAHHQDDLVETMILNMLRGTGRQGLDPFSSSPDIIRPLFNYSKKELIDYALQHGLTWREDESNSELKYRRNKVRSKLAKTAGRKRDELLEINKSARQRNSNIDELLAGLSNYVLEDKQTLIRQRFVSLPHSVANELMRYWLLQNNVPDLDLAGINRATIAAKTLKTGKKADLGGKYSLFSGKKTLQIVSK